MARTTKAVIKRDQENAEKAAERARLVEPEVEPSAQNRAVPEQRDTWLRLQRGNPILNPWMSPPFLVEMWSAASDIDVPLLDRLPSGNEIAELRRACGLSTEQVAERAQVTPEMWTLFENGDDSVLEHVNRGELLRFVSALNACVIAGGPPSPAPQEAVPERQPMTVVGAELLADVERELGERCPLDHAPLDNKVSERVARGEVPSPTLTDWPSEREAAELVLSFPGLANRRRSVSWTSSSLLADLVERDDLSEAVYVVRDEMGVGKAGILRVLGTMAAINQRYPERLVALAEAREAVEKWRKNAETATARARAAATQASALLAKAEAEAAANALAEVGA